MKTAGIIAEYNPFHNGHAYQIETVRKITGADTIVVVMSGNFMQRGAPAFTDKYLRTAMALANGADFIFELPVIYATAGAELFALGGVALLESLGFIDYICFGSECNNIGLLKRTASIILSDNPEVNSGIKSLVRCGLSYPEARQAAIENNYKDYADEIRQVIGDPNNILAIEYLKALELLDSKIIPVTIKRCDKGYNNTDYKNSTDKFIPASAIRNAFTDESCPLDTIMPFIPRNVYNILLHNQDRININEDMFSDLLYYKIKSITDRNDIPGTVLNLTGFTDVSDTLAYRIINNINNFDSFTSFAKLVKTKQYTYSRVCRMLFHILLDIRRNNFNIPLPLSFQSKTDPSRITPYARLLGMNKNKSSILKNIKKTALITKTADSGKCIRNIFNSQEYCDKYGRDETGRIIKFARDTFEKDIFAADIYRKVSFKNNNTCPDEYRAGIIIN